MKYVFAFSLIIQLISYGATLEDDQQVCLGTENCKIDEQQVCLGTENCKSTQWKNNGENEEDKQLDASYQEFTDVFSKWANGSNSLSHKVKLVAESKAFRKLIATEEIKKDEVFIRIPKHLLLYFEMVKDNPVVLLLEESGTKAQLASFIYSAMAIYILLDHDNPKALLQPFYEIWPSDLSHLPMFWSESELDMLSGSYLRAEALSYYKSVQHDYDLICATAPEFARFTLDEFQWASAIVMTRVFSATIDGVETHVLVPYADMLNHKNPRQTTWAFDQESGMFNMIPIQDLAANEQIYTHYGLRSNGHMLLCYGFSLENITDEEMAVNEVMLNFKMNETNPTPEETDEEKSRDLLITLDYTNENTKSLFSLLRYISATEEKQLELANKTGDVMTATTLDIKPISVENEKNMWLKMKEECDKALKRYPTTLQEDGDNLQKTWDYSPFSNKRHALLQVIYEKMILARFDKFADLAIEMLSMKWDTLKHVYKKYKEENPLHSDYITEVIVSLVWSEGESHTTLLKKEETLTSEEKMNRFFTWLNGAKSANVSKTTLNETFMSIHSKGASEANEHMMYVPMSLFITLEMARESPIAYYVRQNIPKEKMSSLDVLYLPMFLLEDRNDKDSFFQPYYDILPKSLDNLPINWNEEDKKTLGGSHLIRRIEKTMTKIKDEYKMICDAAPRFSKFSLDDFIWAVFTVKMRLFLPTINGESVSAMIPYADMLHHNLHSKTYWDYSDAYQSFFLTSTEAIEDNEELFISFGSLKDTDYLFDYGVLDEETEKSIFDFQFEVELDEKDPFYESKLAILRTKQRTLQLTMDIFGDETSKVFSVFRVLAAKTEVDVERMSHAKLVNEIKLISIENEIDMLKLLQNFTTNALAKYADSDPSPDFSDLTRYPIKSNKRHAALQVYREKMVLNQLVHLLEELVPVIGMFDVHSLIEKITSTKTSDVIDYIHNFVTPAFPSSRL